MIYLQHNKLNIVSAKKNKKQDSKELKLPSLKDIQIVNRYSLVGCISLA